MGLVACKSSFDMLDEAHSFIPKTKAATPVAKLGYLSNSVLLTFCAVTLIMAALASVINKVIYIYIFKYNTSSPILYEYFLQVLAL